MACKYRLDAGQIEVMDPAMVAARKGGLGVSASVLGGVRNAGVLRVN